MKTKPEDECCSVGAALWDAHDTASKPALTRYYQKVWGKPSWDGSPPSPVATYEQETADTWTPYMRHRRLAHRAFRLEVKEQP